MNPYDTSAVSGLCEDELFSEQPAQRRNVTPASTTSVMRPAWTEQEVAMVSRYTTNGATLMQMKNMRDQGMTAVDVMSTLRRRSRETSLWSAVRFQGASDVGMTSVKTKVVDSPIDAGIDVVVITVTYDNRTTESSMGDPRAKRMKQ